MSKKTLKILVLISLVFNLTFISAFIYRGIQISKFSNQPFPHPFQKPPMHHMGMEGPMGINHDEMRDRFMNETIRNNMKAMGDLKKDFFEELMKETPDYSRLEKLKVEMAEQSRTMSDCFSNKIIEIRKSSTLEETKRFQAMFDRHAERFQKRNKIHGGKNEKDNNDIDPDTRTRNHNVRPRNARKGMGR